MFINRKPIEPATPSSQKIPTKLKSGGELNLARGIFQEVGNKFQKTSNPPKKCKPRKNNSNPANSKINPCNKSVKITAVCPPKVIYIPVIIAMKMTTPMSVIWKLIPSRVKLGGNNGSIAFPSVKNPMPI